MRFFVSIVLSLSAAGAAQTIQCDPPASIAETIKALPSGSARHAALGDLVKAGNQDFWVSEAFLSGSVYERKPIRDLYRQRFESHADSLDNKYLYSRSLVGFDTKEALQLYAEILAVDPDCPWVHHSQLEIYHSQTFHDRAKLRASFDAVTRVCPGWFGPYRYLTSLEDDALGPPAARLRTMLESTSDPDQLQRYTELWAAEFRIHPDSPDEKTRVAADLKHLREIGALRATIAGGARLIGDTALAREMAPPPRPDLGRETNAWRKDHPEPRDDSGQHHAWAEAKLEASAKWIAMAPDEITGYSERFSALAALDAPADQLSEAADQMLNVIRRRDNPGGWSFVSQITRVFLDRGVLLDRVPATVAETLEHLDDPEGIIDNDLAPARGIAAENRMIYVYWHVEAVLTRSRYYEKMHELAEARSELSALPAYLASKPVPDGTRDLPLGHNLLLFHALAHSAYWERRAELDALENKKDDVVNDYRQALLSWDGNRSNLLVKVRGIWKDLGRSDRDWQAWVDGIPRPAWREDNPSRPGFVAVHRDLPRITLKDLDGNEWAPDRFTSTTTVAVVWATWCGPCVKELPYFAKLADQLKGRPGVQVVSLNADENPQTAKRFVENNGYKFPVLAAYTYVNDLMPYFSIPRTWIMREGAVVEELEGFDDKDGDWAERVLKRLK